jgi:catalase
VAAFAYTAGWFSLDRLTPARMVNALSQRGGDQLGYRRNHAKGIYFTGIFAANGAGTRLSTAPMLVAGSIP